MQKYKSILDIAHNFDVFMFDLFGVLWDGDNLYKDTAWIMLQLKKQNKKIILLSNSTMAGEDLEKSYEKRGLCKSSHYDSFVSSGDIAKSVLGERAAQKFYTVGVHNEKLFEGTHHQKIDCIKDADFIYIGIVEKGGERFSPDNLGAFTEELEEAKLHKKPMFCANPDYSAIGDGGVLYACQGSIAKAYEDMGGVVEWCGKPDVASFEYALKQLPDCDKNRICMVGDTLRTDIKGANDYGIASVLTEKTGITALFSEKMHITTGDFIQNEKITPDIIIDKVGLEFDLHPNLMKKDFIVNLPLCMVMLEDNSYYPWIFLIPRKNNAINILDLSEQEFYDYNKERRMCSEAMAEIYKSGMLNTADIALVTPQMHHHIVIRDKDDPAYPNVVWGQAFNRSYTPEEKLMTIQKIRDAIIAKQNGK